MWSILFNQLTQKKAFIMNCIEYKSAIKETFTSVRDFSYKEKSSKLDEAKINGFLDAINDFKKNLSEKTLRIYSLNDKMEEITWYNDLDEDCLMLLNDLISSSRELHSSLVRHYVSFNVLRKKRIALSEIREFKNSIDELRETYQDLNSVFFFLPKDSEFIETTKEISLV